MYVGRDGPLRGCRAVKSDSCNNLMLSSVHSMLVIILQSVSLNAKRKYYIIMIVVPFVFNVAWPLSGMRLKTCTTGTSTYIVLVTALFINCH